MTIITNETRSRITGAVIKHAFTDRCVELAVIGNDLAKEIYERCYSRAERAAIRLLQDKYEEFTDRRVLKIAIGGMQLSIGTRRDESVLTMCDVDRLVPREQCAQFTCLDKHRNGNMLSLEADDNLGQRCMDWATEREALKEEIVTRRCEIMAVLNQTRTDGQLEAVWPDVMPIAREFIKTAPKSNVPAIPVQDLNAALGLPAVQAA